MGFKLKKITRAIAKPVQAQIKVAKKIVENKGVQELAKVGARAGVAYFTGGASEIALGRIQSARQSALGQTLDSVYDDVRSQSDASPAPVTSMPAPSQSPSQLQASKILRSPKNEEAPSGGFMERAMEVVTGGGGEPDKKGGFPIKAIIIGVVALGAVIFFIKRKK